MFVVGVVFQMSCLTREVIHDYLARAKARRLFRCRFGKSQLPKHGLISNVVKAVQESEYAFHCVTAWLFSAIAMLLVFSFGSDASLREIPDFRS